MQMQTLTDFLIAPYCEADYCDPVHLDDDWAKKHLLSNERSEDAQKIQDLISNDEVKNVLSSPFTYDGAKFQQRNNILKKHNFTLLSKKPFQNEIYEYYSVVKHENCPGYVIKAAGQRIPKDEVVHGLPNQINNEITTFCSEESFLRLEMVERINKAAEKCGIDVKLPKKYLVPYKNSGNETEMAKKYCVVFWWAIFKSIRT